MNIKNLSYDDINLVLEETINKLEIFRKQLDINFDYLLSASKEDNIMNAMLAVKLNMKSIFVNKIDGDYCVKDLLNKNNKEKKNILITQSLLNEEELDNLNNLLCSKYNLYYLVLFGENKNINDKYILINNCSPQDIKLPWDVSQFTPINQLEKIIGVIRADITEDNSKYIGFSSTDFQKEVYITNHKIKEYDSITFQEEEKYNEVKKINNVYRLNSLNEYEILNKDIISNKIDFIEKNGLTHYIEENLTQALILSKHIKLVKIIFFENNQFYFINFKKVDVV